MNGFLGSLAALLASASAGTFYVSDVILTESEDPILDETGDPLLTE